MGLVFSRHRTYGTHRGVWLGLDEICRHADLITVTGPLAVTCAEDLAEGSILRSLDGDWMEIFIADRVRERFFCERIPLSSVA
jgi:hypothetical protein